MMKNNRCGAICYIVGAGDFNETFSAEKTDLVIAADGGYEKLIERGIRPDLLIGDLDSLGYEPDGVELIRHPVEKDETDTALAYRLGYERGYRKFLVFGGTGGRIDHTIANYCLLLRSCMEGAEMSLIGGGTRAFVIRDSEARLKGRCGATVSVFAFGGKACGVSIKGLRYSASDVTLTPEFPLGVSNSYTESGEGTVSVRDGALLVIEEI